MRSIHNCPSFYTRNFLSYHIHKVKNTDMIKKICLSFFRQAQETSKNKIKKKYHKTGILIHALKLLVALLRKGL